MYLQRCFVEGDVYYDSLQSSSESAVYAVV